MVGTDSGVADDPHRDSVAEVGSVTAVATLSFGWTCKTRGAGSRKTTSCLRRAVSLPRKCDGGRRTLPSFDRA